MMRRVISLVSIFLMLALTLTSFQNCSSYQAQKPTLSTVGQSKGPSLENGSGYTGIAMIYPKQVESGETVPVRILNTTLTGISYRLIQGDATIEPIGDGTRALIYVSDTYIGDLIVEVTTDDGQTGLIEIQVVERVAVNDYPQHSSYGTALNAMDWVFVSVPKVTVNDSKNAGKVMVYRQNKLTGELTHRFGIQNPLAGEAAVDSFFGSKISSFENEVLIGTADRNLVHYFKIETQDNRSSARLEATIRMPESIQFGHDMHIGSHNLVISDPGDHNASNGRVYIAHRNNSQQEYGAFTYITSPDDCVDFGRSVDAGNGFLYVSAIKIDADNGTSAGVLLVYDIQTLTLLQTVAAPTHPAPMYGETFRLWQDLALLGNPRDDAIGKTSESVDVYRRNVETGELTFLHTINSPEGEDSKIGFGSSLEIFQNQLFIGAPQASSLTQQKSGLVYLYRITSEGEVLNNSYLSPDFERYEFVSRFGRTMDFRDGILYISMQGKTGDINYFQGNIYTVSIQSQQ